MKTPPRDTGSTATGLICSPDPVFRDHLERLLQQAAIGRCHAATDHNSALRLAFELIPGLVVVDHLPPGLDGIKLVHELRKKLRIPILFTAASWECELSNAAITAGAAAFITRFPTLTELHKTLCEARSRLVYDGLLRDKLRDTEQRLEERKVIEKAKGLVMEREGISENEAFKKLRSQSMARRVSMAKLAEELITAAGLPGWP